VMGSTILSLLILSITKLNPVLALQLLSPNV